MIPKFDAEIFEDCAYSILSLAEGEREDNDLFFQFRKLGCDFFLKNAVVIVDGDGFAE